MFLFYCLFRGPVRVDHSVVATPPPLSNVLTHTGYLVYTRDQRAGLAEETDLTKRIVVSFEVLGIN